MTSSREEMVLFSPAKINWILRVPGRRDDGFHEIETIFQTISLGDRIVCHSADEYELSCSDPAIPVDSSNLVTRALEQLGRAGANVPPFSIHIEKSIPAGGGLGGGSSNAASILRAFRDRFAPEVNEDDLAGIAADLGSDVPFFLQGGTAYARGRGEQLEPLPAVKKVRLLLAFPEERVSTAEAYALLGRGPVPPEPYLGRDRLRDVLASKRFPDEPVLVNDFEEVIFERLPRLRRIREQLVDAGATWARMSGSGSTVVGAFADEESRQNAQRLIRDVRLMPAETI